MSEARALTGGSLREKTFLVEGLDCADCARQLEEGIRRLEGVDEAVLSYASGKLHLRYRRQLGEVRKMMESHGYRLLEEAEGEQGSDLARKRTAYAVVSAMAILFAIIATPFNTNVSATLLLVAILTGGHLTFRRGIAAIRAGRLDMNTLMTVAVAGALLINEWWEAATVAFLFAASHALETYTAEKNRRSIRALMDTVPEEAHRLKDGVPETVPVEAVLPEEEILVRPGERIPLDGTIVSGSSYVTQAAVTGESLPVSKERGGNVYAGTLNGNGSLTVRVKGSAKDSTLANIVRLVEEAQARRAPAQQFIDRFAQIYTPVVIALAAAIAILGPVIAGGGWQQWVYRGLALLIVACPCALVVSTPVSIVASLTNAARQGILVKGGVYLEQMRDVNAIVFDKTGTLTKGTPMVTRILSTNYPQEKLLQIAASLEAHSEHVLAEAIRKLAKEQELSPQQVSDFTAYPGKGVTGTVDGTRYYLGSPAFLAEHGYATSNLEMEAQGNETPVMLASEQTIHGALLISDTIRQESRSTLDNLRNLGIEKIAMLTGDREEAARPLALSLGLDDVAAGLLPEQKEQAVRRFRTKFGSVAMVGDGINDAPALASADVGIAMGAAGSPTALETADIALMSDELDKLPFLITLSRRTMGIIRQNIAFALLIKGLAIMLVFPGWLTLWLAILADMGASILVTANGMRLLR
ncbi:heavy metal translocating P-type ATPase [Dethiobacter alkaliphilus]|uniref:heavy metal translocating P-type ATPase n=1 Tax=Dethiobacter alkaliphilus TaxID=427926 RepID=UPI0022270751|nr:cation-translocating P-type ATPase [Dethiobacter alkaliphilus]MCW3491508.1 cation-translocating P-type ATPase [Dethiobacter alkaliphilus]